MKITKTILVGLAMMFWVAPVPLSMAGELVSMRRLSHPVHWDGKVRATLTLRLPEVKPSGLIVKEILPKGWSIATASSPPGRFDNAKGEVKWLFFGDIPADVVIDYEAIAPPGWAGVPEFSGTVLYIDAERVRKEVEIGGDRELTVN